MPVPTYSLTLHKTYFNKGFFNFGVGIGKYVQKRSGVGRILFGPSKKEIACRIDRSANRTGAPRIHGGAKLRDQFQSNCKLHDKVQVAILDESTFWIKLENTKDENLLPSKTAIAFAPLSNSSNASIGRQFELAVQRVLREKCGLSLNIEYKLRIGVGKKKKDHRFDLGAKEPEVIVECKAHTWTNGNNIPSAKLAVWNEAMYYFAIAPTYYRKIFCTLRATSAARSETLAEYYVRTYGHLIPDDVEFFEYDPEDNILSPVKMMQ